MGYFFEEWVKVLKFQCVERRAESCGRCLPVKIVDFSAAFKEIDVKHKFIAGPDSEFPVNILVMFFDGVHADKRLVWNICNLVTVNVEVGDIALGRRQFCDSGQEVIQRFLEFRRESLCTLVLHLAELPEKFAAVCVNNAGFCVYIGQ